MNSSTKSLGISMKIWEAYWIQLTVRLSEINTRCGRLLFLFFVVTFVLGDFQSCRFEALLVSPPLAVQFV